jgi:SAM-dependent methyltransferase
MRSAVLRAKSEADFHDAAYQERVRTSASSFYSLLEHGSSYYRQFLRARCPGKCVLEYGCGENSVAPYLIRNGVSSYVGIDISSVAIAAAEKARDSAGSDAGSKASYHIMNAEALEFEDISFDLICGIAILHHLDLAKAYAEIARTLRPDGAAIFLEPLAYNPLIKLYRLLTPHLRTRDEHPLVMRDIQMAELSFGSIETGFFNLFTLLSLVFAGTSLHPKLYRSLHRIDERIFARFPAFRRYAWTVSLVLTSPRKSTSTQVFGVSPGEPLEA